jgi:hypothetical protein
MTTCTCSAANLCNIARSNTITVSRCRVCGAYRLTTTDGTHSAGGDTLALCEIIESLIKQKRGTYATDYPQEPKHWAVSEA